MVIFMMTMVCLTALGLLVLFTFIVTRGNKKYSKDDWIAVIKERADTLVAEQRSVRPELCFETGSFTFINDQEQVRIIVEFQLRFKDEHGNEVILTPSESLRHASADVAFLKEVREQKRLTVTL